MEAEVERLSIQPGHAPSCKKSQEVEAETEQMWIRLMAVEMQASAHNTSFLLELSVSSRTRGYKSRTEV